VLSDSDKVLAHYDHGELMRVIASASGPKPLINRDFHSLSITRSALRRTIDGFALTSVSLLRGARQGRRNRRSRVRQS
jgi:hypothetical protein